MKETTKILIGTLAGFTVAFIFAKLSGSHQQALQPMPSKDATEPKKSHQKQPSWTQIDIYGPVFNNGPVANLGAPLNEPAKDHLPAPQLVQKNIEADKPESHAAQKISAKGLTSAALALKALIPTIFDIVMDIAKRIFLLAI